MTTSTNLFSVLSPLVGTRCYPLTFVQPDGNLPVWPAIRYTRIGGDLHNSICMTGDGVTAGFTDTEQYQLDIVAKTHAALEALELQVRAAFDALATMPTTIDGLTREFDSETRTYRTIMTITVSPF